MRYLLAAVLYTALAATANADMSDLEALRAGDMRKLQIHSAARPAPDTVFLHADGSELRLSDYRCLQDILKKLPQQLKQN